MANQPDSTPRACKHCDSEKPIEEFPLRKGYRQWKCYACENEQRRAKYVRKGHKTVPREEQRKRRAAYDRSMKGRFIWIWEWTRDRPVKQCSRCKIDLPANPAWFPLNTKNSTGLSSWCRACNARLYDEQRTKRAIANKARYDRLMRGNPEHLRENRRNWQASNYDKKRASEKRWHEQNREASLQGKIARQAKRRAQKLEAGGSFTRQQILELDSAQKSRCWYCSSKMSKYHVEHRIPLSRGGSNDISNIVLACPPCNLSKGAKMPWEMKVPRLL